MRLDKGQIEVIDDISAEILRKKHMGNRSLSLFLFCNFVLFWPR